MTIVDFPFGACPRMIDPACLTRKLYHVMSQHVTSQSQTPIVDFLFSACPTMIGPACLSTTRSYSWLPDWEHPELLSYSLPEMVCDWDRDQWVLSDHE